MIEASGLAQGSLRAGAARAKVAVPFPILPAGYPPPRPDVTEANPAIEARAVMLEVGPVKIGIVELDLLTAPRTLVDRIQRDAASLGLSDLWVIASHAHSSMGAYDPRLVSELAGTGRYRADAFEALVVAAKKALNDASASLVPSTITISEGDGSGLNQARSGGEVDPKLTRIELRSEGTARAELWILAAHPTLVPRKPSVLSPDYPGVIDGDDGPVTLVLQGGIGNASAKVPDGDGSLSERFARAVRAKLTTLSGAELTETTLGFSRVSVGLPRPDSSRLSPWFARAAGDNLLCTSADRTAEVRALRLGDTVLIGVPAEPTGIAAAQLERKSGATRVLSLVGGYLGYVEPAERVKARQGESVRQYFGPGLLSSLVDAAELASGAVRPNG